MVDRGKKSRRRGIGLRRESTLVSLDRAAGGSPGGMGLKKITEVKLNGESEADCNFFKDESLSNKKYLSTPQSFVKLILSLWHRWWS